MNFNLRKLRQDEKVLNNFAAHGFYGRHDDVCDYCQCSR